jgi:hypothetical protein
LILKPLYRVGRVSRQDMPHGEIFCIGDRWRRPRGDGEEGCFRVDAVENKSGVVMGSLLIRMILLPLSFARNSLELGYFIIIL